MSLKLVPDRELRFSGPHHRAITCLLRVTNIAEKTQMFKIKTTAPRDYCVRPTCGTIKPKETRTICIRLQPNVDFTVNSVHKFMIISLPCPDELVEYDNFNELWKTVEMAEKPQTFKLKSEFSFTDSDPYSNVPISERPRESLPQLKVPLSNFDPKMFQPQKRPNSPEEEMKSEGSSQQTLKSAPEENFVKQTKYKDTSRDSLSHTVEKPKPKPVEELPRLSEQQKSSLAKLKRSSLDMRPVSKTAITDADKPELKVFERSGQILYPNAKGEFYALERRIETSQLIVGLTCFLLGLFVGTYLF